MIPNYEKRQLIAEFTRPANVTAYAAGDVITDTTTMMSFTRAARITNSAGGEICSAILISSAASSTLQAELYLFDTAFTIAEDNAAFNPSDTQIKGFVGVVPFYNQATMGDLTNTNPPADFKAAADYPLASNTIFQVSDLGIIYQCASGSATLFGVLVARNAYTPASGETFTIKLGVDRD